VTRVLVAAASPVVRAGLEALLAGSASLVVVPGSGAPASLPDEVEAAEPDVVLLEVPAGGELPPLPLVSSPDALPRAPAVVALADDPGAAWTAAALRAGVRAVLPRAAGPAEIVAAVEAAAAGLVAIPADAVDALLSAAPSAPRALGPADAPSLTARELQVLAMMAEGFGNKGIATRLGISSHTAKSHVAAVLAKLHAATRAEAVAVGARLGLILV
jgi:DNA-binding NarL/FixJ family response regulator